MAASQLILPSSQLQQEHVGACDGSAPHTFSVLHKHNRRNGSFFSLCLDPGLLKYHVTPVFKNISVSASWDCVKLKGLRLSL